ncbi:hypothetical protein ACPPVO_17110 [Dactylosporangium sp. McL0621]|uniref:hypothetical protein n=1 Tax=Dactylosporangium sp. McL0621 TaxID=3415678 RepID=UPI003CEE1AC4
MNHRIRTAGLALATAAAATLVALGFAAPARAAVTPAALALRWAPIHYQDVDQTGAHAIGGRADYLSKVDYDGDLVGRNNWEHAPGYALRAYVYYSVVETGTHWYLTYMFFHPRDWIDHPFFEGEHENDAEGVLLAVEKDGSAYGVLRAAVTVAHSDFYSFTPAGSGWTNGGETIDGTLSLAASPHDGFQHPVTAQEAHGHGLKAWPYFNIDNNGDGDGIVYYPSATTAEVPSSANDRDVQYQLIDVLAPGGLWAQRANPSLFAGYGTFAGDDTNTGADSCGNGTWDCTTDSANAPWGWDDGNDVPGRGELATDPAHVAAAYFTVPGSLARTYTSNGYTAG